MDQTRRRFAESDYNIDNLKVPELRKLAKEVGLPIDASWKKYDISSSLDDYRRKLRNEYDKTRISLEEFLGKETLIGLYEFLFENIMNILSDNFDLVPKEISKRKFEVIDIIKDEASIKLEIYNLDWELYINAFVHSRTKDQITVTITLSLVNIMYKTDSENIRETRFYIPLSISS